MNCESELLIIGHAVKTMLDEENTCRIRLTFRCPLCRDRLVLTERDNYVMIECERCRIRLDLSYEDIRLFMLERGHDVVDAATFEILYEKYIEVVRCIKPRKRKHDNKSSTSRDSQ